MTTFIVKNSNIYTPREEIPHEVYFFVQDNAEFLHLDI